MRKNLGSRVLAVRRRSRANYQNLLIQNYFPVTRRPPEKISQIAKALGKNFSDREGPRKKFLRPRRPSEKISQTAKALGKNFSDRDTYRTRKTIGPRPSPSPGEMGSRTPGPLRSESVSGWAQIAIKLRLF